MKNLVTRNFWFLLGLCFVFQAQAVHDSRTAPQQEYMSAFDLQAIDLIQMDKHEVAQRINRKLTIKEKLLFRFVKNKLKKYPHLNTTQAVEQVKTDGLAIAGFITGLVSLFVVGILLGTLGIIFSSIALSRIKKQPEVRKGRGFAIAGLVLGIIGVIGALVFIAMA